MAKDPEPLSGGNLDVWGLSADLIPTVLPKALAIAWKRWRTKRMQESQDVLVKELRNRQLTIEDVAKRDPMLRPLWRYFKAADDGVAEFNLRLLAQVLAYQAAREPFDAGTLDTYMAVLGSFTPQEVVVVATLHRHRKEDSENPWAATVDELTPRPFASPEQVQATAARALRSGLLIGQAGYGFTFSTSPDIDALGDLPILRQVMADPFTDLED